MPSKTQAKQAKMASKQIIPPPAKAKKVPAATKKTPEPKRSAPASKDDASKGNKKVKVEQTQIVKVVTKGGAAVDSLVPNK